MSRPVIEQLPVELANLIAAGEVVERPASVVKELMENAIDANATVIRIDLIDAGLKKITVIDNGIGMTKDEMELAVLPHATSKIKSARDLFCISTLGFRGEALPSISSISKMSLTSSIDGYQGYQLDYEAGQKKGEKIVSFPRGTKIEVIDLFFNTPARLKHLSQPSVELSHIVSYVNRIALAQPHIAFILSNNGKVLFSTSGEMDYAMILSAIYGHDVAKHMVFFSGSDGLYQIEGYASTNYVYRSNKNAMTFVINQRVIKNQGLSFAVTDAYKTLLPVGKYPVIFLLIQADTSLVDVNVHPTKQEVRFTDEFKLKQLISQTIQDALNRIEMPYQQAVIPHTPSNSKEIHTTETYEWDDFESSTPLMQHFDKIEPMVNNLKNETKDFGEKTLANLIQPMPNPEEDNFFYTLDTDEKKQVSSSTLKEEQVEENSFDFVEERQNLFFSEMIYLGQYHQTYLLLEKNNDLYLLDQHAAMERYMYEKIIHSLETEDRTMYRLLVPIEISVPIYELDSLKDKKDILMDIGIDIRFGKTQTIEVLQIPTWIPKQLETIFLEDIFQYVLTNQQVTRANMLDNLAKQLSCKQSIKAGMDISVEEVQTLLSHLDQCKQPFTCPHGRPTIVQFTQYEIEKMFKRII
ncbi:MAG: DNA mismatch repair endonuclease MutL [Prevotella sp.]|nr:DNA mismatch repair endonuclease MutL [Staphylococcus sp.]MCM1349653.1 DNA mismatch repair endonuclease MutL [Prevotella sp.]